MFNRQAPQAPLQRFASLVLALLVTVAMFAGVDSLATAEPSAALLAQMQAAPRG